MISGQRATSHHQRVDVAQPEEPRDRMDHRAGEHDEREDEQAADDEHHRPAEVGQALAHGRRTRPSPWIWSRARPASVKTFDAP